MLTFLPIVVYAQLDINKLQDGKRGFGFGYRPLPDFIGDLTLHNILITGDHGFTENIKGSGQVTISFLEENQDQMLLGLRNQIMHVDSMKSPGIDVGNLDYGYFLLGGIDIVYAYVTESVGEVDSDFYGLNLFAGGGLYASFGTLKPFVLYNFNHSRVFEAFGGEIENWHLFSGGIHFNLSDSVSLMGRVLTDKEFDDYAFEIGINFGSGKKTRQYPIETPTTTFPVGKVEQPTVEKPTTPVTEKKVEPPKVEPPTIVTEEKTEQPKVVSPTTPASFRYKKDDTLLVKVKDYLYFAKVTENTITTAKEVPVEFFINEINIITGKSVTLNAVHAKREKPEDGWGSHKVTIEYYDGTEWKTVSDVLVFEDFYLLPESVTGERRIGLDKIRIPNPNY